MIKIVVLNIFFVLAHTISAKLATNNIGIGVLLGNNHYFWDDLQDYKRINRSGNFNGGVTISYSLKKAIFNYAYMEEVQKFSNIRTGPIFNGGTVIRRDIDCKYNTQKVGVTVPVLTIKQYKLFSENSMFLSKLRSCNFSTQSQNGYLTKKSIFTDTFNRKLGFSCCFGILRELKKFRIHSLIGLNSTLFNIETNDEFGRDVLNFNSRVSFCIQIQLTVKLFDI